ncbi:MAG: hypothetical protein K1X64_06895 [Myxococcaceae bacterium]|nr:hypothetical protein [Myxococcaceae bacterium]
MENRKRFNVFSITQKNNANGAVWARAGTAYTNRDGSLNIYLDVLPLEGQLHLREVLSRREEAVVPAPNTVANSHHEPH